MRAFQDHLQEHGLRKEEVEVFGNCLFLSIARHVAEQEDMYSPETPENPEFRYKDTACMVRNLSLNHMLEHRLAFESSFGKKSTRLMITDQMNSETGSVMEEVLATDTERDE